jgi:hypothetical protein
MSAPSPTALPRFEKAARALIRTGVGVDAVLDLGSYRRATKSNRLRDAPATRQVLA